MRLIAIAMVLFAGSANTARPDAGVPRVLAMLKSNSIAVAAVAESRAFSGARSCDFKVAATEPSQFEPGTTYDYVADIACAGKDASSIIHVSGRMLSDGPQALTLSIMFAE